PKITHGLLAILTDRQTGASLFRRVTVAPQKPQRYVRPRVDYDRQTQQVRITVEAQDRAFLPPDPVKVAARASLGASTQTAQLAGKIEAPDYTARLFLAAPPDASRVIDLYLDIDGYPRAYAYQVPLAESRNNIAPDDDRLAARITSPPADSLYK